MEKKKVRATRKNGRKDSNGVFKAGHNDRSFNLENAEHVDADRSKWNVYEYYGAAEPPVRCGESHLSGLTEPLRSL